jgi:2-polyprenyl-6-hydroxyphenyl methylase/3-demethylubiquinone-9 3-methyltransferase
LNFYSNVDIQKKTAFDKQSFDLVFALDVLEHIFDPLSALSEIRRILKDNGLFFISVPSETLLIKYIRNLIDYIRKFDINPHHWEGLIKSEEDFFNLLKENYFEIIIKRKFPINSFPKLFSYDIFYLVKKK